MAFLHSDSVDFSRLGGKAGALARLGNAGFRIPAWFVVPSDAVWTGQELEEALAGIGATHFAVRSSGAMEDGAGHSFAGQFESYLDVVADDVPAKIEEVRASARKASILTYCHERNLPEPEAPAVLVQRMISPRCAGVAFSADPVSGRRSCCVISAVNGTGEKLVSGEAEGEDWSVADSGQIHAPLKIILTQEEALAIAALAKRCEAAFGRPQDIEWAIDSGGVLWLLQSRPITTLESIPDPDDSLRVWDNSNIAESYGGVTTPLTFSFARRIYEHVYREFCKLMSVPKGRIERADDVFPRMLGLVRGRTYYNLGSWYRVLALLPGFQVNRSFMEQMMGVKRPLPDLLVKRIVAESSTSKAGDLLALAITGVGLVRQWAGLKRQIRLFRKRLDEALAPRALERMSGEELAGHYRDLESRLLRKWDAPLVNDFFAMIFYGVLRSLCEKWAGDEQGSLQNELLADTGDIISAEPPRRILAMAKQAAAHPGLPELLIGREIPEREKLAALRKHPELAGAFERYLEDFGDRCLEELKLESPTVRDDAQTLLTSIGALALRNTAESNVPPSPNPEPPHLENPFKRAIFGWVLEQAKERVRCRENLRFERTRLFGRVRAIMRELGKRLHADGRLAQAEDIFYLELGEILAVWDATGTTEDLTDLAARRRVEFEGYRAEPAPPDRFQTRGPLHRSANWEADIDPASNFDGQDDPSLRKGTGACPGVVRGKVRVVLDPRDAHLEPGEILVAQQTDPGWVVLFPAASGLLVERGSLLSHSAIVSRELRLPCIVSLSGITTWLKTGDEVEMNGSTGHVRLIGGNGFSR